MACKRKSVVLEENSSEQPILRRSSRTAGKIESPVVLVSATAEKDHSQKNASNIRVNYAKRRKPTPQDQSSRGPSQANSEPQVIKETNSRSDNDILSASEGKRQYWLMKAEPEPRFERGVDVSFSIDDLAAKTEPEPWDGIRNYVARNNLRAMKKGDLAFFYHSNCKEPGIVGTMEVVQEHSPDLSAHDARAPYYDASSKPDDPKWSVVHVEFRSKFVAPITLKKLREMGSGPGKPLQNMQMLKQSRLSVSKVSKAEWDYLLSVAKEKGYVKADGL